MLLYSLLAPGKATSNKSPPPQAGTSAAPFLLGVSVTVLEFPTALPYLGAISLLTAAELGAAVWLPVLLVYNLIFILPPTLLLLAHMAFGKRLEARFDTRQLRLRNEARETVLWLIGIVGFFLLADALSASKFFGLLA